MKKIFILFFVLISFSFGFNKKATIESPTLVQSGQEKHWCPICGMKLKNFYKTNHIAKLPNGLDRQYCSMRCLAVDMQEYDIDKNHIKVIDVNTQKPILAKDAHYVYGSRVNGTMTKKSKLAFSSKEEAKKFAKKYKGKVISFEETLNNAKESLKSDIAMVNKKKKKKVYPKGKKIFKIKCNENIDPTEYIEINELKAAIVNEKLCKKLKENQLQAVALYLWEVKRFGDLFENNQRVKVEEHEKCPVCGMFTYKYPRWAAQIFYKNNGKEHHYSFDGVKDLMKFYFNPMAWGNYETSKKENITKILVTDYYSQKAIDAVKAFYVIRSDIYGPMGHEFIPFSSLEEAQTFKKDHYGTKILKFEEITEEQTYKLDEN